jgi:carbon storage regulator
MLVLSRKIGERIVVPDCELAVTVLAVEGKTVRLGISAPEDIAVYREEVWQQLCRMSELEEVRGQEHRSDADL